MYNQRYNDYYLVTDEDHFADGDEMEIIAAPRRKQCGPKRVFSVLGVTLLSLALISFVLVFVAFPLTFKYSLKLQQSLVFTRFNLVTNRTFYNRFRLPTYKNHYVSVTDIDSNATLKLGLWHILPVDLAKIAIYEDSYDYDDALKNSNYSVLLYFHGTGEDRSQSWQKYRLFRYFFHVITFDYRGYGDSDDGPMFEKNVVNDCVQVYKWLQGRTNSPIYVWGHSLGTALAVSTLTELKSTSNVTGVVLEAAFTSFRDELYYHPNTKYFRWLPWFESTVVNPLTENGFIFNTSQNLLNIASPIMFLHAFDDSIVPYFMSEKLYATSLERDVTDSIKNASRLYLFNPKIGLNHYFIYRDSYTFYYVYDFMQLCSNDTFNKHIPIAHIKVNLWL